MESRGIDVSHWQGNIDFNKVKASGIDFVILKAGGSDGKLNKRYRDKCFEQYYKDAKAAGLCVGAYYFVGKNCNNVEEGMQDAVHFEELLNGKQFDMPVYMDFEAPSSLTKSGNTQAAIVFCQYMESAGYFVGIYASDVSGFNDRLENSKLSMYNHWVARYGSSPKVVKSYGMWQYSSKGRVTGINGNVDLDIAYLDFPTIIKKKGFNGFNGN